MAKLYVAYGSNLNKEQMKDLIQEHKIDFVMDAAPPFASNYIFDAAYEAGANYANTGMVYIMDPRMDFGNPSKSYYDIVRQGYEDCGLDTNVLDHAVNDSMDLAQQRMECEGMRFF